MIRKSGPKRFPRRRYPRPEQRAYSAFFSGYEALRSLSAEERDSLAAFCRIRPIWDKGDILAMRAAWGDEAAFGERFAERMLGMYQKLVPLGLG